MDLEFIRKDVESQTGNCPALYKVPDTSYYVVQGKKLDAETTAKLRDLGFDETAVLVSANVIAGIVDNG